MAGKPPNIDICQITSAISRRRANLPLSDSAQAAQKEIAFAPLFDYQIVNDDLDTAVAEVLAIVDKQLNNLKK